MKKLIVILACVCLNSALAPAQDTFPPPQGLGYGFVGAGTDHSTAGAGFGAELFASKGLALGVEIGSAGLGENDKVNVNGVGSASLSYHFFPKKLQDNAAPYVGGGYTSFFGHHYLSSSAFPNLSHGYNIGGGVDLFATRHFGLRFDVRYYGRNDTIYRNPLLADVPQSSFTALRIRFTFR